MTDTLKPGDGDRDVMVGSYSRGNSVPYDGVFWLEPVRTREPVPSFTRARQTDSEEVSLPQSDETR